VVRGKLGKLNHKEAWIRGLLHENKKPGIVLLEVCSGLDRANSAEIYWINLYNKKSGGKLLNIAPGGNVFVQLGRKLSVATKRKIQRTLKQRYAVSPMKPFSKEYKQHMSKVLQNYYQTHKRKPFTKEHCENIRRARLGRHHNLSTKTKMGHAQKLRWQKEKAHGKNS